MRRHPIDDLGFQIAKKKKKINPNKPLDPQAYEDQEGDAYATYDLYSEATHRWTTLTQQHISYIPVRTFFPPPYI